MTVRPFTARDYPAIHQVYGLAWPGYAGSVEVLRRQDRQTGGGLWERWVAVEGTSVIGFAEFRRLPEARAPGRFTVGVYVRPDAEGRGTGSALYAQLIEAIQRHAPQALRATAPAEPERGLRFLQRRGFLPDRHYVELHLDPQTFEAGTWPEREARLAERGIELLPLADLEASCGRALHRLTEDLRRDAPFPDGAAATSYARFREQVWEHPGLERQASFAARRAGVWVGLSLVWTAGPEELFTGLTGVRRPFRRLGVAAAMKARGILAARELGACRMRTVNQQGDAAILDLNRRLGFVPHLAWHSLVLPMESGASAGGESRPG